MGRTDGPRGQARAALVLGWPPAVPETDPTVFCLPDDKHVPVEDDHNLLQALLVAGIPVAHACGGSARCSTCRLHVLTGAEHCAPRTEAEQEMAERLKFDDCIRLACQTRITGEVAVRRLILDDEDEELASQLDEGNMGDAIGREIQAAILMSDVEGFTALSEVLPPYDVIHLLNRFFHHAGGVIQKGAGHVDNYMGDGLLAYFSEEECADEAALGAVRAGLGLLAEAEVISGYTQAWYGRPFKIRVGIAYGSVVAGTVGDAGLRRNTIIGDPVNTASRIESAAKETGTRLLISQGIYTRVEGRVEIGGVFEREIRGKEGLHCMREVTGLRG